MAPAHYSAAWRVDSQPRSGSTASASAERTRTYAGSPKNRSAPSSATRTPETFLEDAILRGGGEGLPAFIERELREFLSCGVLARGFARFRCDECGHEILVAFSCKGRAYAEWGNMPSTGASRRDTSKRFAGVASLRAGLDFAGPISGSPSCATALPCRRKESAMLEFYFEMRSGCVSSGSVRSASTSTGLLIGCARQGTNEGRASSCCEVRRTSGTGPRVFGPTGSMRVLGALARHLRTCVCAHPFRGRDRYHQEGAQRFITHLQRGMALVTPTRARARAGPGTTAPARSSSRTS